MLGERITELSMEQEKQRDKKITGRYVSCNFLLSLVIYQPNMPTPQKFTTQICTSVRTRSAVTNKVTIESNHSCYIFCVQILLHTLQLVKSVMHAGTGGFRIDNNISYTTCRQLVRKHSVCMAHVLLIWIFMLSAGQWGVVIHQCDWNP